MRDIAAAHAGRPDFDKVISDIADYVLDYDVTGSRLAMETARYCWMDAIACALYALDYPACTRLLGPLVPGAELADGARVPGTRYQLEPVRAAWNIGVMVRWLDFNDTWLAAEWGHPSDNLGAILSLADYQSRAALINGGRSLTMRDIIQAMIRAYEIQGVIALENSLNRVGLDHVMLVRIASAAVTAEMLGCDRQQICNAVSNAWLDGASLRTYRHAPNTGSRKSWAGGDATARGLFLALLARLGEMGYPSAVTAQYWGFQDALFRGKTLSFPRGYGSYVIENVLFKIAYPAEFHGQTAVEAALKLHVQVRDRLDDVDKVLIETQAPGNRIINKSGPLHNPADRDHCIQYMVAVPLIFGRLTAADYEDAVAQDPRIDALREKMQCIENERFSREYLEPDKRAIGNSVQVWFKDGSRTDKVVVEYPVGHRRRRAEANPLLEKKFADSLRDRISPTNRDRLLEICGDQAEFEQTTVDDMMRLLAIG